MTYIEFFDESPVENICACLWHLPKTVILVGNKGKLLKKHAARYAALFARRGQQVEFLCRSVNPNDILQTVEELDAIVQSYEDCSFDLTGGDEAYLVAVGILFERYGKEKIKMHRFNLRTETVTDFDGDGATLPQDGKLSLSVEELIRLHGGEILYDTEKPHGTHLWKMEEEFQADILKMWAICRRAGRAWNQQIAMLAAAQEPMAARTPDPDAPPLSTFAWIPEKPEFAVRSGPRYAYCEEILRELKAQGLVRDFSYARERFFISYKNEQVKRCLLRGGQILEMIIYLMALRAKDEAGAPVYNDVMTGVCIDWDGEIHLGTDVKDTENEIDAIFLHGTVPVFVSCKNGMIETEELYKLQSVAQRFGGKYAKKVLIAASLEDSATNFDDYFRARAKEMGICLVETVRDLEESELQRLLGNLWQNA